MPINFLCVCLLLAHCKKYDGLKVGDMKVCLWIASVSLCSTPDVFPHLVLKSSGDKVTGQEPPVSQPALELFVSAPGPPEP